MSNLDQRIAALSGGNAVFISTSRTSSTATGQARAPQPAPELRSKPQLN